MRKGEIGADKVNQALINLTSQGAIFAGGATKQADTLNGKLSTLQDTIDTLARTIGTELEDEIKGILDISIKAVKQISKLVESIGLVSKLGKKDMIKIETEARTFATKEVSKDFGFFERRFSADARKQFQEIFNLKKQELITEALTTKELTKQDKTEKKIKDSVTAAKKEAEQIKQKAEGTTLAFGTAFTNANSFNESLGQTNIFTNSISNQVGSFSDALVMATSDADKLKETFMEIGRGIEDGIVSGLTDAVMGTKSLAEVAVSVLNNLKRKLVEVAMQRAVSGIGNFFGNALGGIFGGGGGGGLVPFIPSLGGLGFRANGGRVSANQPYMVGERGREMFVPSTSGKIIPNNQLGGGNTNIINVSVDASGTEVQGDEATSSQLGKLIGLAVQQELVKQSRAGGLLSKA